MRILRRQDVTKKIGLERSAIYQMMGRGQFPRPVQLASCRSVGWLELEIDQWIADRTAERDAKNGGSAK